MEGRLGYKAMLLVEEGGGRKGMGERGWEKGDGRKGMGERGW